MRPKMHGVHVPNRKYTAELAALRLPIPETVEIPMSMHIGAPAIPVVKPGDKVKVGQLIGKAGGFVSAPIYASVSGTVKKINQAVASSGRLIRERYRKGSNPPAFRVGEKVPVRYDAEKPERFTLNHPGKEEKVELLLYFAGLLFILAGGVCYLLFGLRILG